MNNENLNNNSEQHNGFDPKPEKTLYLPKFENKPSGNLIIKNEFAKEDIKKLRLFVYIGVFLLAGLVYIIFSQFYTAKAFAYQKQVDEQMDNMRKNLLSSVNCTINSETYIHDSLLRVMDKNKSLLSARYESDDLVLVSRNYSYGGRDNYVRQEVKENLENMIRDARLSGHYLELNSAFRSFDLQSEWFESTSIKGIDGLTAVPGSSEHQLGTAVDMSSHQGEAATLAAYVWLEDNAHKYGFNLTYPRGKKEETGFDYEPWHWRYIGKDLASKYKQSGELFNSGDDLFIIKDGMVYPHNYFGYYLGIYLYEDADFNKTILDNGIAEVYPITAMFRDIDQKASEKTDFKSKMEIRGVELEIHGNYIEKLDAHIIFVYEKVDGINYTNDEVEKNISKFCPSL